LQHKFRFLAIPFVLGYPKTKGITKVLHLLIELTKEYFQLTQEQRYVISALKSAGVSNSTIAKEIGVHKSTVGRELKRNTPKRGVGAKIYNPIKAQLKTDDRHKNKPKNSFFSTEIKLDISAKMSEDKLSPELIVGGWKKNNQKSVSIETIYKFIWESKFSNKKKDKRYKQLHKHLKHGKRRRKRGNYKDSRGLIPNRVSIEKRPKTVEKRKRVGDIEVDLIIGKNHQSGLLVTLDRVTLVTTIDKIENKKPEGIKELILKRMEHRTHLKTMTFDNDQAFGLHEEIAQQLNIKTYFTRPYTSQDKGSIENRNGTIRRFFPKKTDFNKITNEEVKIVETKINNRPIRKYDYKSANEVHLQKTKVALII
jgi:transposase, IS30 family